MLATSPANIGSRYSKSINDLTSDKCIISAFRACAVHEQTANREGFVCSCSLTPTRQYSSFACAIFSYPALRPHVSRIYSPRIRRGDLSANRGGYAIRAVRRGPSGRRRRWESSPRRTDGVSAHQLIAAAGRLRPNPARGLPGRRAISGKHPRCAARRTRARRREWVLKSGRPRGRRLCLK